MKTEGGSPDNEKRIKPNLLENFEGCVEAVFAIESAGVGSELSYDDKSVLRSQMFSALKRLEEETRDNPEDRKSKVVSGFQGLGGFNRYGVRRDGTIALYKSHAFQDCVAKAVELGIDTPQYFGE